MTQKTEYFMSSTDNTQQLHYTVWDCESAKAVLQIVHGMEEYIDRYDELARTMNERGWAVIGHDHLGHGKSGKWERGFFTERKDGADVVIADMYLVTEEAKHRWSGLPVFVMGHSMGSFFLRRYLALHGEKVAGAIICGTGWYNALLTGSALVAAKLVGTLRGKHCRSKFVKTLTSPHALAFRNEGKNAWLSRNPENVKRFEADPLCGFGFTCGAYQHMYRNLLRVSLCKDYDRLKVQEGGIPDFPVLVISGAEDSVGGSRAVKKVAAQYRDLGFSDVTERAVPEDRHEVLMEPDGAEVRGYIADWLETHL